MTAQIANVSARTTTRAVVVCSSPKFRLSGAPTAYAETLSVSGLRFSRAAAGFWGRRGVPDPPLARGVVFSLPTIRSPSPRRGAFVCALRGVPVDEPARGWRGAPVAVPREFVPAEGTWPLDGLVLRRAERGELPPDGRGAWGRWGDITVIFPVVAHAGCPPRRVLVQPHKITTPYAASSARPPIAETPDLTVTVLSPT